MVALVCGCKNGQRKVRIHAIGCDDRAGKKAKNESRPSVRGVLFGLLKVALRCARLVVLQADATVMVFSVMLAAAVVCEIEVWAVVLAVAAESVVRGP